VNWFGKHEAVAVEVETDADRLRILEAEYRADEAASDEAYQAVKVYERVHNVPPSVFVQNGKMYRAMNQRGDPIHQGLLRVAQDKQFQRGVSLRAFTEMKIRMGLVK
jgi:hypothetical protein